MIAPSHDGPRGHGETCSPECPACAAMRPPERKPVAGWVEDGGWWRLGGDATVLTAIAYQRRDGACSWGVCSPGVMFLSGHSGEAKSIDEALLAAEDALIAVRDEIGRAVGR